DDFGVGKIARAPDVIDVEVRRDDRRDAVGGETERPKLEGDGIFLAYREAIRRGAHATTEPAARAHLGAPPRVDEDEASVAKDGDPDGDAERRESVRSHLPSRADRELGNANRAAREEEEILHRSAALLVGPVTGTGRS